MKTNTVTVIYAVIQKENIIIYTKDGESIVFSSVNPNLLNIANQINKEMVQKNARQMILNYGENVAPYLTFQEETKGFIRFFNIAKNKIKDILGISVERGDVSKNPMLNSPEKTEIAIQPGVEPVTPEIMEKLEKANSKDQDSTVVAVVGDIPIVNAENLKEYMISAMNLENQKGFQKFMELFATLAKKRKHTAQELMAFMKLNNLPVTHDGHILAYKSLTKSGDYYLDNHSSTFKQNVGTVVLMDAEMVDDNRRTLCSNGLHIASPSYLRGYGSGNNNDIFIVKIHPADVVSVPLGEPEKIRVLRYHILYKLSPEMKQRFKNNFKITPNDPEASVLYDLVHGRHVARLNKTHKHRNGKFDQMIPLEVSPVISQEPVPETPKELPKPEPKKKSSPLKKNSNKAVTINDKENPSSQEITLDPSKINQTLSQKQQFLALFETFKKEKNIEKKQKLVSEIQDFKKKSKKSYKGLGLSDADQKLLNDPLLFVKK